jgi:hypothetical protein
MCQSTWEKLVSACGVSQKWDPNRSLKSEKKWHPKIPPKYCQKNTEKRSRFKWGEITKNWYLKIHARVVIHFFYFPFSKNEVKKSPKTVQSEMTRKTPPKYCQKNTEKRSRFKWGEIPKKWYLKIHARVVIHFFYFPFSKNEIKRSPKTVQSEVTKKTLGLCIIPHTSEEYI